MAAVRTLFAVPPLQVYLTVQAFQSSPCPAPAHRRIALGPLTEAGRHAEQLAFAFCQRMDVRAKAWVACGPTRLGQPWIDDADKLGAHGDY